MFYYRDKVMEWNEKFKHIPHFKIGEDYYAYNAMQSQSLGFDLVNKCYIKDKRGYINLCGKMYHTRKGMKKYADNKYYPKQEECMVDGLGVLPKKIVKEVNGQYYHKCQFDDKQHQYNYRPPLLFQQEGKENEFFGFEFEYNHGDRSDFREASKSELFYFKNDGSLEEGIEIVSHPLSRKIFYKKLDVFRKLFRNCDEYSLETANNTGFHIHCTKPSKKICLDIAHFIATHRAFFKKLAGRDENQYCRYDVNERDRYRAVNITNKATIEFRFFRNTKTDRYNFGRTECVFCIMDLAHEGKLDIDSFIKKSKEYFYLSKVISAKCLTPTQEESH